MQEYMDLLGHKAEDRVTGFSGVVTSVCFDLYGCVMATLAPAASGDKLESGHWFDAKRLKVTSKTPVMTPPAFGQLKAGDEQGPAAKPGASAMPVR